MICCASSSVMGHLFTFFIRVTVAVHPALSLVFPRGWLKRWQMGHLAPIRVAVISRMRT